MKSRKSREREKERKKLSFKHNSHITLTRILISILFIKTMLLITLCLEYIVHEYNKFLTQNKRIYR